ncbi:MAG: hypothetical protein ABSG57_08125 [Candidatus Bathyarchaeia archaeon]
MSSEDRKVTSVSFNKLLWANFRAEAKHRGEQIQDVFDRLMASYISPKGENTNSIRKTVSVVTEEEVWHPRTPKLEVEESDEKEDSKEEPTDEEEEEDEDGFKVEPHLPGFGNNLVEVKDEPEEDDEEDFEDEDAEEEEEW